MNTERPKPRNLPRPGDRILRPGERTGFPGLFANAEDRDFMLLVEGL